MRHETDRATARRRRFIPLVGTIGEGGAVEWNEGLTDATLDRLIAPDLMERIPAEARSRGRP